MNRVLFSWTDRLGPEAVELWLPAAALALAVLAIHLLKVRYALPALVLGTLLFFGLQRGMVQSVPESAKPEADVDWPLVASEILQREGEASDP